MHFGVAFFLGWYIFVDSCLGQIVFRPKQSINNSLDFSLGHCANKGFIRIFFCIFVKIYFCFMQKSPAKNYNFLLIFVNTDFFIFSAKIPAETERFAKIVKKMSSVPKKFENIFTKAFVFLRIFRKIFLFMRNLWKFSLKNQNFSQNFRKKLSSRNIFLNFAFAKMKKCIFVETDIFPTISSENRHFRVKSTLSQTHITPKEVGTQFTENLQRTIRYMYYTVE